MTHVVGWVSYLEPKAVNRKLRKGSRRGKAWLVKSRVGDQETTQNGLRLTQGQKILRFHEVCHACLAVESSYRKERQGIAKVAKKIGLRLTQGQKISDFMRYALRA